MRVFINPGHMIGGVDSGAVNRGLNLTEAEVTLKVGELVRHYLKEAGCEARMLQSDNLGGESPRYKNVCKEANTWGADVFVSLHCNAFNGMARGVETLVYDLNGKAGALARCVQRQLVDTLREIDPTVPDRGLKVRKNLIVLKRTAMPAVLVEMAFIDNEDDVKLLIERQDDIARAIARGVTDYGLSPA